MPVTTPADDTVATDDGVQVHVPPGVDSVREILLPTQTPAGPSMESTYGDATDKVAVALQPVAEV